MRRSITSDDGIELSFTDTGPRFTEAVLLVHGLGLSAALWSGLGYVNALRGRRVIAIDLRGHGHSARPTGTGQYTFERLADDIAAVISALEIETVTYVGYSLGARLGFCFLERHPEHVRALCSIAGAPRLCAEDAEALFFKGYKSSIEEFGMDGFVARWMLERPHMDAASAHALARTRPETMLAILHEIESDAGTARTALEGVTTPTLLITGNDDRTGLRGAAEAMQSIAGSQLVRVPDVDHIQIIRMKGVIVPLISDLMNEAARR